MVNHVGFRGAGVQVGIGDARVLREGFDRRGFCTGVVESLRVAHGPAVWGKVVDVEKVARANGALGIGQLAFSRGGNVSLAPCDHKGAFGIDLSSLFAFEDREQAFAGHGGGDIHTCGFEEGGREVHEVDKVVDSAPWGDVLGPACGQGHFATDVVEVALATRKARDAVVPADDDEGVVEFAHVFEAGDQDAQARIHRLTFAQVVAHVFPNRVDVGQEVGQ